MGKPIITVNGKEAEVKSNLLKTFLSNQETTPPVIMKPVPLKNYESMIQKIG